MNRSRDWWIQAQADLRHAQRALGDGDYDWACFAAHQASEKALKAVFEQRRQKVWGHSVTRLLQALQDEGVAVPADLVDAAKMLDKHYCSLSQRAGTGRTDRVLYFKGGRKCHPRFGRNLAVR